MIEGTESTIVLSHHYDREGKHYKPGDAITLPTADARSLVAAGYAKALMTPMVADDPNGTTLIRATAPARLTTDGGTTYTWAHEGEAVPVRNGDVDAVLALPGFDRADPVEEPAATSVDGHPITDDELAASATAEPQVGDDAPVRTEPTDAAEVTTAQQD